MKKYNRANDTAPTFSKEEAEEEERIALEILADQDPYKIETLEEIVRKCHIRIFHVS